jgi:hypothetical protein
MNYKAIFGSIFFLGCLDGENLLELDDFSRALIDTLFLVCEEEVVGQDDPSPEWKNSYLRQDFRKRDCFSQKPSLWID